MKTFWSISDILSTIGNRVRQKSLDGTERKIIFGNLPPIYETHRGIYNDLQNAIENWNENCGIGNIFLKYVIFC